MMQEGKRPSRYQEVNSSRSKSTSCLISSGQNSGGDSYEGIQPVHAVMPASSVNIQKEGLVQLANRDFATRKFGDGTTIWIGTCRYAGRVLCSC